MGAPYIYIYDISRLRVKGGGYSWTRGPEDGNGRLFRKVRNYIGL